MGEYTIDNSVSETVKARHDDEIVVLSLFDGISCAHVGLETAGFTNVTYYASEIDKWASAITRYNYPQTIHLGDVCNISKSMIPQCVDLMIGGSPCQDLSIAKQDRKGLDGDRSGLFWQWVRLWEEIQPKYWILENVNSMPQEAKTIISTVLDVEPIMINSSLVSAQNRKRLFWTNIYTDFFGICHIPQPEDRGILLKHILENGNPAVVGKRGKLVVDDNPQKAPTIMARDYKGFGNQPMAAVMVGDKSYAIPSTYYKENVKSLEKRNKKGLIVTEQSLMDKLQELSPRVAGMTITNGRIRPYRDTKDKAGISEIGTIFSTEGKADTVTTNHPVYILDNAKVIVPEATIKGYAEAEEGDSIDLSYPNSKTRRGRVSKKAPSQMTQNNVGVLVRDESSETGYTIRKLTPLEIERLFTLPDHYTAHGVDAKGKTINISNTQRYKALGNGFVCDVVAHIMSYMGVDDE